MANVPPGTHAISVCACFRRGDIAPFLLRGPPDTGELPVRSVNHTNHTIRNLIDRSIRLVVPWAPAAGLRVVESTYRRSVNQRVRARAGSKNAIPRRSSRT